ncbi:MAG: hypothetical protein OXU45_08590 [Candidatus Melainabacteria bacterium]|nr:hypothetical protein [Candidatus Melainabacteria bacterium]
MKLPRLLLGFLPQFNQEQKSYIGNILGIGGGAVLFTWWQMLVPLTSDMPEYGFFSQAAIIAIAGVMIFIAIVLRGRKVK